MLFTKNTNINTRGIDNTAPRVSVNEIDIVDVIKIILTPIIFILSGKKCSIPLYSQVFRWFREKHNLESHVKKDWTDGILQGYESIIECLDGYIDVGTFKTYEEAELECLKKLIETQK